tara:strand:- start:24 stop:209 length:186 start_codon:yes stop_codon:yes gene_type:complete
MKKYIMKFTGIKKGFFSDTVYNRSEIITSSSLENAYEEQIARASTLSLSDLTISVTDIQPL